MRYTIHKGQDTLTTRAMQTDLTFITNEKQRSLLKRFQVLIKDTRFFDVLVGYFYTSGFHALYKSLEDTEKIRILIGISTNPQTSEPGAPSACGGVRFEFATTCQIRTNS